MPPYIRRPGSWDWFTPAEVRHLPQADRQRLTKNAYAAVRKDRSVAWIALAPFATCVGTGLLLNLLPESLRSKSLGVSIQGFCLLLTLLIPFRQRQVFRRSLHDQMLAEGIRPAVCFDCRYFTEGFEGNECPNCGAVLFQEPAGKEAGPTAS